MCRKPVLRSDDSIKRIFGEHVAKEQETKMEFPTTFLTQFLILTKRMFIQNKRNAVSVNVRSERAPCFFSDRCSWHSKWLTSTYHKLYTSFIQYSGEHSHELSLRPLISFNHKFSESNDILESLYQLCQISLVNCASVLAIHLSSNISSNTSL